MTISESDSDRGVESNDQTAIERERERDRDRDREREMTRQSQKQIDRKMTSQTESSVHDSPYSIVLADGVYCGAFEVYGTPAVS